MNSAAITGSVTNHLMNGAPTESAERLLGALRDWFEPLPRVVVAFSGGVDSTLVARVAHDVLGDRSLALTARSASLMAEELDDAVALADEIGIVHRIVDTGELDRAEYRANAPSRCYYCKTELFDATTAFAGAYPSAVVVDGFNLDDMADHRPGHVAAAEHQVRHPLAEVGLRKVDVRAVSKLLGLRTWSKPQLACLSSRVPYGMEVTAERLERVAAVERALRQERFHDLRARLVRDNDDMVRIEVGGDEWIRIGDPEVRTRIVAAAKAAGFRFVTVDLEAFRSGRMNDALVQLGQARSSN